MANMLAWGEWRPDVSSYKGQHSPTITNAIPRGDGYGPMKSFNAMSSALTGVCRGLAAQYDDDGSISVFAGTVDKLWKMSNTDFSWDDVSGPGFVSLPSSTHWQWSQFGNTVIAVNGNQKPQKYVLASSTDFEELGGDPPNAKYCSVVGPFLVLSGLIGDDYSIHWSSRNNLEEWIIGVNEGDTQTFRDGGLVRGVAGGEYGLVFQDRAIRRMTYSPGSAVVFEFDLISRDLGLMAPYSLITVRDMIFFLSAQGFQMYQPLMGFKAIGKERVDRTFFNDCDVGQLHMIIGAADPQATRVVWTYKSTQSGTNEQFDRLLAYDWQLDRWAGWINIQGEYLATAATPGMTLEGLDAINTSVDALTLPFDAYPATFANTLAMVNTSHVAGLLNGSNLEVTLETPMLDLGSRAFVSNVRPITDCADVLTSIGGRPRLQDPLNYSVERGLTAIGSVPFRFDSRELHFKNRFPAGSAWTYSMGVEPDLQGTGAR